MLPKVRFRTILGHTRWITVGTILSGTGPLAHAATENEPEAQPQSNTAEASPDIVAPKALRTEVDVPTNPEKRELVVLELLVTESGSVESATIVSGAEPFAAAALRASDRFTFEPARYKGKSIAAKIRFLVRFEPELVEPVDAKGPAIGRASGDGKDAKPTQGTKQEHKTPGEIEVVVLGVRPAFTTSVVTRAEARELPGTFGDPLRAVESSPGITPIFSGVPFFFVRGAPPGNVGFYLDGVKVPLLYHAVLGPSVVHPGLIDHVDMYRGAPDAQYGRYAGAIIAAQTRKPVSRLGGEANLRVFDAGGLAESPFASGKGHVLLGGRYSYTALAASLATGANLSYWDYQARADYETGRRSRASVFAFGSYDHFAADQGGVQRGAGTQFHRVDFRHDIETERVRSRVAVTLGYDETDSTSGALKNRLIAARTATQQTLGPSLSLDYGGDVSVDSYRISVDETTAEADDIQTLFPARTDVTGGAFAQLRWQPASFADVAPGLRIDGYRIADKTATSVDPRLSITFHPGRRLFTNYTVGLLHQAPNFVPQVPAAQVGTLEGGLQRAWSASSTVGMKLPADLSAAVTGYRVAFFDLLDPIGRDRDLSFDPNGLTHRERGSSIGLELELRRPMTSRIGGFLGCTLSRTERSSGTRESLSAFDRPVVVQGALGIDLGRNFRAGARIAYYSGIPALEIGSAPQRYYSGDRRTGPYFRADVRLEKRWAITERGYWAFVAEMLNATMSRETTSRRCSPAMCQDEVSGPIAIPSIGVEVYSY